MCNMNDNIQNAVDFYRQFTGKQVEVKLALPELTKQLPVMITAAYSIYTTEIMGMPVIFLGVKNPGNVTPLQLQKHQNFVMAKTATPVVFVLERIASYNLSRLATARVNFIVPGKQIFVPTLMMNMKEVKDGRVLEEEIMPGMAQCILLYHIEHGGLTGKNASELAEQFHVSYPNMSRALRWLEKKGLCLLNGTKTKSLVFDEDLKVLWEKALPLMPSPVERKVYTDQYLENSKLAGESAMEELTMLAGPQIPVIAVSKAEAKAQENHLFRHEGKYAVEIWRYDPHFLTTGPTVDPLSLYLSMKANDDERVRIESDKLVNFIK